MIVPRVIPCLLLKNKGLVKGVRFKKHRYIGDPINTIQIFNTKEVDEIILLDIAATFERRTVSPEFIQTVANECLMPFSVGGGIRTVADIRQILKAGAEKVCLNTYAFESPELIRQASETFGKQSVIVSVDIKKNWFGDYRLYVRCGRKKIGGDVVDAVTRVEEQGAGEVLINFIDRDGTGIGYDIDLISRIRREIQIPMIALGGAGEVADLEDGIVKGGAAAVAAGSMFVFYGQRRAVLISYPNKDELTRIREK